MNEIEGILSKPYDSNSICNFAITLYVKAGAGNDYAGDGYPPPKSTVESLWAMVWMNKI